MGHVLCRFVLLGMISVGSLIYFGLCRVCGASRRGGQRLEYLLLYVQSITCTQRGLGLCCVPVQDFKFNPVDL
jgi:hypothetical protein